MANIKITCPKCGGTKHDIILEERDGHRIPIGFKCLEPGCSWQGPSRKITWDNDEVINIGSCARSIDEMSKDAEARGEYHHTKYKDPSVGKRKRSPGVQKPPKVNIREPEIPKIVLQEVNMPNRNLMASTPVKCPTCDQPVVDLWVTVDGIIDMQDEVFMYHASQTALIKCSICGEPIGLHALVDKFSFVPVIPSLFNLPAECNICHVTPGKYPIQGNLVFSWTGTEWKCTGNARLMCIGCSNVLSVYK